ncbi:hypothetical protein Tco_0855958 [Tanacetum coccineum]
MSSSILSLPAGAEFFLEAETVLFPLVGVDKLIDQGVGSTSGIRACALRNFDLEDIIKKKSFTHKEEMAPMALSDSKVNNDKSCSKTCLTNYEALKKQYDDLLVKLDDTGFKASTYKRGLSILEGQILKYKESEVLFSEEIALLKRSVGHKEYLMGLLRTELEKVKEEKEGFEFKIAKFEKSAKDLDQLLASQITDKSKKGLGYSAVPPPHPLILNRPTPLDLSYSGLDEFKEPEFKGYGPENSKKESNVVCENSSNETKKNSDAPIIEEWVSDNEDEVESPVVVKKKTVIPTAAKIEKPVRKPVRYAEMYRSQRPRGNQRNWNGQKSHQLGSDFVMIKKACYICGSFDHLQYTCKHKRHVNSQREEKPVWKNTRRVNDHYSTRMTHSNPRKNMIPQAVLIRSGIKEVNTAKPKNAHNAVKRNSFNTVKASACWVWMPKNRVIDHVSKYNNASVTLKRLDYIDAQGRFKSVMAWMDAQTQGRQECNKEKEESIKHQHVGSGCQRTEWFYAGSRLLQLDEKLHAAESLLVVSNEVMLIDEVNADSPIRLGEDDEDEVELFPSCPKTAHSSAHKHMAPRAVLMKTGLKSVNTARPVNTVRSVNTDGCTNSREARVQQRKRLIQRRVQQKQKDQEDEVFGRILSAKKMKITAAGEKVNAAESLLVVSTEVNAN